MYPSESFLITRQADVIVAKRRVRELAHLAGFDSMAISEIAIVITELATNLVKHAGQGHIDLNFIENAEKNGIEIVSSDNGPGIASQDDALRKGFSTSRSLGYGLGIVNELMDELDIQGHHNGVAKTVIKTRRWLKSSSQPEVAEGLYHLEVGIATRPHPEMELNGDAFIVLNWPGFLLVCVIDGLGHGPHAHHASELAKRYIEQHKNLPIESIFSGTNKACHDSRGVVMALYLFDLNKQQVAHASIGNIESKYKGQSSKQSFPVHRGVVGINMPSKIRVNNHTFNSEDIFVLFSDGISANWSLDDLSALHLGSADKEAQYILNHYGREHDDATITVVRVKEK